jgi:hypothetical protein
MGAVLAPILRFNEIAFNNQMTENKHSHEGNALPAVPFSLFFQSEDGQVKPKRIFTVTRTTTCTSHVELFISELHQVIVLDFRYMQVCMFSVN